MYFIGAFLNYIDFKVNYTYSTFFTGVTVCKDSVYYTLFPFVC